MPFLRKYNTLLVTGSTSIRIPIIKRAVVDFALGADWTPAAGDVRISVDGAANANVTNLPTAIAAGNTAFWEFILTAAELSGKQMIVTVADAATKAVEDQSFLVETYGNASAKYVTDLELQLATPTNITAATGIVLSGVTHTGAVIPTVSAVTGLTASNLDAAITSRMATYTQPTGFLAATFPAGTVANTTNITAGTMTTTTNLTNLPAITANWLTAAGIAAGALDGKGNWNIGKTGYSLTQTFPANFSDLAITVTTGRVTVGTNADKTGYALTTADHIVGADTMLDRNMATGTDSGSPTVRTVRQALRFLRNKWSIAAGTLTVTKEDDVTASFTATVTTDAAAVPIIGNDPA